MKQERESELEFLFSRDRKTVFVSECVVLSAQTVGLKRERRWRLWVEGEMSDGSALLSVIWRL